MTLALSLAAAAAAILLFLLTSASANTALLSRHFPLLMALNGAAVIGLLGLVLFQLRGLWREYRARTFGSRLKYRLLLMFGLMALGPGLLVYAISVQFVQRSIESWFDVRVDAALEGGISLGRTALDYLLEELASKGRSMAIDLADSRSPATDLNRLREQAGVSSATLFSHVGQIIAASSADLGVLVPEAPPASKLRQVRAGRPLVEVQGDAARGLMLNALIPVPSGSVSGENRVLQLRHPVSGQLAASAESVQAVYRDYQELSLARRGLKLIYILTLTLSFLLGLLAAIAIAFLLARRLSAPLSILAEGTAAVAQGDYSPRQSLPARDELGVLTQSFNRMTRQLDEARALAERSRADVEAARAHLESVLANLSAGVMAFDAGMRLRSANPGARRILRDELPDLIDRAPVDWPRHAELAGAITQGFAGAQGQWQSQVEAPGLDGMPQVLLLRGSRLPEASGGGAVVVFDDITQLIAAQRAAAWGEVARRLAHEIKNPLTPIQLSAERLEVKLSERLTGADREILERSTRTIVNQVEAMKIMVNAFRDYARLPPPELGPVDINALTREVLALYDGSRVGIATALAEDLQPVRGDASQLRQVLHNLIQNAEDALCDQADAGIEIATGRAEHAVRLIVRDNGPGFAPAILARAFEPYVTTKARGTGLGLAMVKKIIDEHRGAVRIANRAPRGAEVRVELPLYD